MRCLKVIVSVAFAILYSISFAQTVGPDSNPYNPLNWNIVLHKNICHGSVLSMDHFGIVTSNTTLNPYASIEMEAYPDGFSSLEAKFDAKNEWKIYWVGVGNSPTSVIVKVRSVLQTSKPAVGHPSPSEVGMDYFHTFNSSNGGQISEGETTVELPLTLGQGYFTVYGKNTVYLSSLSTSYQNTATSWYSTMELNMKGVMIISPPYPTTYVSWETIDGKLEPVPKLRPTNILSPRHVDCAIQGWSVPWFPPVVGTFYRQAAIIPYGFENGSTIPEEYEQFFQWMTESPKLVGLAQDANALSLQGIFDSADQVMMYESELDATLIGRAFDEDDDYMAALLYHVHSIYQKAGNPIKKRHGRYLPVLDENGNQIICEIPLIGGTHTFVVPTAPAPPRRTHSLTLQAEVGIIEPVKASIRPSYTYAWEELMPHTYNWSPTVTAGPAQTNNQLFILATSYQSTRAEHPIIYFGDAGYLPILENNITTGNINYLTKFLYETGPEYSNLVAIPLTQIDTEWDTDDE